MLELKIKLNIINDIKEFLATATKIDEDVDLIKGRYIIDAKSTMGLFTVDLSEPVKIVIHSDNKDFLELFRKWEVQ